MLQDSQKNNPLHGIKLATMLEFLIEEYGFDNLHKEVQIRAFSNNPSFKSALKFLRTTPWAREKIEALYLKHIR